MYAQTYADETSLCMMYCIYGNLGPDCNVKTLDCLGTQKIFGMCENNHIKPVNRVANKEIYKNKAYLIRIEK